VKSDELFSYLYILFRSTEISIIFHKQNKYYFNVLSVRDTINLLNLALAYTFQGHWDFVGITQA
jgi:hypothetical protein